MDPPSREHVGEVVGVPGWRGWRPRDYFRHSGVTIIGLIAMLERIFRAVDTSFPRGVRS